MRTSDRTYSQQLGFQDQDRNDKLHNGCCLYLCQSEKLKKLADRKGDERIEENGPRISYPILSISGSSYGSSPYKRVIGYLDVFIVNFAYKKESEGYKSSYHLGIEVKKGFVDVTSAVQQIETYRKFIDAQFLLCTMYKIDELYRKTLKDHGIGHLYVDENDVIKFLESQKQVESERF